MRLLFLPGFACGAWVWERARPALEARWECSFADWPKQTEAFDSLELYADWLGRPDADAVVGHSMGGLLALMTGRPAVLVDTFLLPPGPFFQNQFVPGTPELLRRQAAERLRADIPRFHPDLRERLRSTDCSSLALRRGAPAAALYGMRESRDEAEVLAALGWPEGLKAKVPVKLVPEAAHFLMLEQPDAFVFALAGALDEVL